MVAKEGIKTKKDLRSTDASKAYCVLCKKYFTNSKGNSNSVDRHMNKRHKHVMDQENASHVPSKKHKTLEHTSLIL